MKIIGGMKYCHETPPFPCHSLKRGRSGLSGDRGWRGGGGGGRGEDYESG